MVPLSTFKAVDSASLIVHIVSIWDNSDHVLSAWPHMSYHDHRISKKHQNEFTINNDITNL